MKIIAKNKKAQFNYEIIVKYEAGIALKGAEIKAIRTNNIAIQDSYVNIANEEVYVINMNISNYKFATSYVVDPLRKRKLLLHKTEIKKLKQEQKLRHYVIIPLQVYINTKGIAKLQIALAKPRKIHDKREEIKKRDLKRQLNSSYWK